MELGNFTNENFIPKKLGRLGGTYSEYLEMSLKYENGLVSSISINVKNKYKNDIKRLSFMAEAIKSRDYLIAKLCATMQVESSIDLGSDFGSLVAHQLMSGVSNPIGIDLDLDAVSSARAHQLLISQGDIGEFITQDQHYDCITSLNITQKKWVNDDERFNLIRKMLEKSNKLCVLTLFDRDLKKLEINPGEWMTFRLGNRKKFSESDEIRLMYGWPFGTKLPLFYEIIKSRFLKIDHEDFFSSYLNLPVVFIRK